MPDFLIHRCTLRVVRRGGWSWGPNPKQLVEQLVHIFPVLLANKLAALYPNEEDREIAAPLRIRIPVRLSDFGPASGAATQSVATDDTWVGSTLDSKVEAALRAALGIPATPCVMSENLSERVSACAHWTPLADPVRHGPENSALEELLMFWHEQNILAQRLDEFSLLELEAWHAALWQQAVSSPAMGKQALSAFPATLPEFVRRNCAGIAPSDMEYWLRQRILIAVNTAARFRIAASHPTLWQMIDRLLPALHGTLSLATYGNNSTQTAALAIKQAPGLVSHSDAHHRQVARPQISTYPPAPLAWDTHVDCALPFLLLGPLAAIGFFRALAAVLEAAKIPDQAHLFAAALAQKVLEAPQRGWLRSASGLASATAFAGLKAAPPEEQLVDLSRQVDAYIGLLDRLLADTLIRGHTATEPVLICRADTASNNGYLLVDAQGCFPIAWAEQVQSFFSHLRRLDRPMVLVSREATAPALLEELDRAGFSFLLDVPPLRHEPWARVQQGVKTLAWTNHAPPSPANVVSAAQQLPQSCEEAKSLWRELGELRVAVVRAASAEMEHTTTLAASLALGDIAWKLWSHRGRTSPQLTLERFADLDAHVHFDSKTVTVRLPLGRRHHELSEHGLLRPIRDLPWLPGRCVEFAGG